jgi:hypothetical protein
VLRLERTVYKRNPATGLCARTNEVVYWISSAAGQPPGRWNEWIRARAVQRSLQKVIENIDFSPPKAAGEAAGGKEGLVGYLTTVAREEPVAFLGLLGKVLPLTLAGGAEMPLRNVTIVELVAPSIVRPAL